VYVTDINNRVWASFDEGMTWKDLTANLHSLTNDPFIPTIEIYSTSPSTSEDVLLAGKVGGVFAMVQPDRPGASWTRLGYGLAPAPVFDLHYDYPDNVLLAGTGGRGAWTLSNPFSSSGTYTSAAGAISSARSADGKNASSRDFARIGSEQWASIDLIGLGG